MPRKRPPLDDSDAFRPLDPTKLLTPPPRPNIDPNLRLSLGGIGGTGTPPQPIGGGGGYQPPLAPPRTSTGLFNSGGGTPPTLTQAPPGVPQLTGRPPPPQVYRGGPAQTTGQVTSTPGTPPATPYTPFGGVRRTPGSGVGGGAVDPRQNARNDILSMIQRGTPPRPVEPPRPTGPVTPDMPPGTTFAPPGGPPVAVIPSQPGIGPPPRPNLPGGEGGDGEPQPQDTVGGGGGNGAGGGGPAPRYSRDWAASLYGGGQDPGNPYQQTARRLTDRQEQDRLMLERRRMSPRA